MCGIAGFPGAVGPTTTGPGLTRRSAAPVRAAVTKNSGTIGEPHPEETVQQDTQKFNKQPFPVPPGWIPKTRGFAGPARAISARDFCTSLLPPRPHVPRDSWGGSSLIMSFDEGCAGWAGAEPQTWGTSRGRG